LAHPEEALFKLPMLTKEVEQNEAEVELEEQYWAYETCAFASNNKQLANRL